MKTNLFIKKIPNKGRGIFTSKVIHKGEIIEKCELLIIRGNDVPASLEPYVFQYTRNKVAIALGNGSLYNHSEKPNCEFFFKSKEKLYFRAIRKIKRGEELTINYGYSKELKQRFNLIN